MPPKRKLQPDDSPTAASVKKSKSTDTAPSGVPDQPTNKVLPVTISFPAKSRESSIRIASWNICGWAASQKKGFKYYVEAEDADILVLTETKMNNEPVDQSLKTQYPYCYWAISTQRKSYSGTAILSKFAPISTSMTLPGHPNPEIVKGRIITLEYEKFWLVGTYVVNAGEKLKTLQEKKEWNLYLEKYLRELDSRGPKGVIWTGDLNVAPSEIDLSNAKRNWNKTPGYTEAETSWFNGFLNPPQPIEGTSTTNPPPSESCPQSEGAKILNKFVDVWRYQHPTHRHYTYFSYRFNCREKGIGWRLDMFVASERLLEKIGMCEIRSEIYGASDHCPIVMEIDFIKV